ncbi:MAG: alpha/beta hydrolase, partial [Deltaproteobacteria bacterium]|nr:alpha/beta hydrolase [Deltaproteobacteria bacterium]
MPAVFSRCTDCCGEQERGGVPALTLVATERDPVPHGAEVDRITAADGTVLRVARWLPSGGTRGTVVILNGRTEFVEKYFEVIGDLLRRHYAVATLDWRGQGLSDRPLRNRHKGHVRDFGLYVSLTDLINLSKALVIGSALYLPIAVAFGFVGFPRTTLVLEPILC